MSQSFINLATFLIGVAGLLLSIFNFYHLRRKSALEQAPKVEVLHHDVCDSVIKVELAFCKGADATIFTRIQVKGFLLSSGTWSFDHGIGAITCDEKWNQDLSIFLKVGSNCFSSSSDSSVVWFTFFAKKNKADLQDSELLRISLRSTDRWRNLELMHQIKIER